MAFRMGSLLALLCNVALAAATTAAVCPQLVPGSCSPRCGKDPRYPCAVLSTIPCSDAKVCCAACLANPQCEFFTLTQSRQLCHLKTNSTQLGHGDCTSGRVRGSGPPPGPGPPAPGPAPPRPPPPPPPPAPVVACWENVSLARLPFCDPSLEFHLRAKDLVARLTLDETVSQLVTQAAAVPRLGVDFYGYDQECNSGIGVGMPQNIGMAATFNRSLLFAAGRGTGSMLRARANEAAGNGKRKGHALNCWSPMINVMRHPLWGRNHEGYGESVYLSGAMATEVIRGMQGRGLDAGTLQNYSLILAGAKHFAAFDGPKNGGEAVISASDWLINYTPNFEAAVIEGGAQSLMCTYARSNFTPGASHTDKHGGTAGCSNRLALTTLLRERWQPPAMYVVSDCGAVHDSVASLTAGCDLECPFGQQSNAKYKALGNLSRAGLVSEAAIEVAATRLFTARMSLGEFDRPSRVPFQNRSVYSTARLAPALERLSEEAARQSLVLLHNPQHALPLFSRDRSREPATTATAAAAAPNRQVAVVGLETRMDAGYDTAGDGPDMLTSTALRSSRLELQVITAVGCMDGADCEQYNSSAVTTAVAQAGTVLVFLGSGGEEAEMHDLSSLELKGNQTQLLADSIATAPPDATIVVVLLTCAPLNISGFLGESRVGAVVQAFYPQHAGGTAIANALLVRITYRHNPYLCGCDCC